MGQRFFSIILMGAVLTVFMGTDQVVAQTPVTDLPGWFTNPPSDDGEFIYTTSMGETYRDAVAQALQNMAEKISSNVNATNERSLPEEFEEIFTDSIYSSSSQIVAVENIAGIKISSLVKINEMSSYSGTAEEYSANFESALELRFDKDSTSYYEVKLYAQEIQEGDELDYFFRVSEDLQGASFSDLLEHIEQHPDIRVSHETRWSETGYDYFVLIRYSKKALDQE